MVQRSSIEEYLIPHETGALAKSPGQKTNLHKNLTVALPLSSFSLSCGCCKQPLEFTDKNCSPRQCFAASLRRNYCRGLSNASRLRVCYSNHPSWIKGADLLDPPSPHPLFLLILPITHCLLLFFPFNFSSTYSTSTFPPHCRFQAVRPSFIEIAGHTINMSPRPVLKDKLEAAQLSWQA